MLQLCMCSAWSSAAQMVSGDEVKKQYATSEDLLIMREDDVLAVID